MDAQKTLIFSYLFTILNSSQGTIVFIFHCIISKSVRDDLIKGLRKQKNRLFASFSSTYGSTRANSTSANNNSNKSPIFGHHNTKNTNNDTLKRGPSNSSSFRVSNKNESVKLLANAKKLSLSSASSSSPPPPETSLDHTSHSKFYTLFACFYELFFCFSRRSPQNTKSLTSTTSSSLSCSNSFDLKNASPANIHKSITSHRHSTPYRHHNSNSKQNTNSELYNVFNHHNHSHNYQKQQQAWVKCILIT